MQAVLLIKTKVTVALNHSAESQKYAGSRPLVVHGEGGKPCSIPHLKTPIQQALNLRPAAPICVVWDTVYTPRSGETCSRLLFWRWKENITSGSSAYVSPSEARCHSLVERVRNGTGSVGHCTPQLVGSSMPCCGLDQIFLGGCFPLVLAVMMASM